MQSGCSSRWRGKPGYGTHDLVPGIPRPGAHDLVLGTYPRATYPRVPGTKQDRHLPTGTYPRVPGTKQDPGTEQEVVPGTEEVAPRKW